MHRLNWRSDFAGGKNKPATFYKMFTLISLSHAEIVTYLILLATNVFLIVEKNLHFEAKVYSKLHLNFQKLWIVRSLMTVKKNIKFQQNIVTCLISELRLKPWLPEFLCLWNIQHFIGILSFCSVTYKNIHYTERNFLFWYIKPKAFLGIQTGLESFFLV